MWKVKEDQNCHNFNKIILQIFIIGYVSQQEVKVVQLCHFIKNIILKQFYKVNILVIGQGFGLKFTLS